MRFEDFAITAAALTAFGFWVRQERKAMAQEAPSEPAKPPAPLQPLKDAPMPLSVDPSAYITPVADAIIAPSGMRKVNGRNYLCEPLIDRRTGLYARLSWKDAKEALSHFGLRFIAESEWYALFRDPANSFVLEPCTLVSTVEDQQRMRTQAYCEKHDACVRAQFSNWDGNKVLVNCGKQWLPEQGVNFGWFRTKDGLGGKSGKEPRPAGTPIQTPGHSHVAEWTRYTDYSQLTQGCEV